MKLGNYKINALYGGREAGSGAYFSIKEGKLGGNLLRWDYGPLHNSAGGEFGLHSTFRVKISGIGYGSTAQYPWQAPFTFWKYKRN